MKLPALKGGAYGALAGQKIPCDMDFTGKSAGCPRPDFAGQAGTKADSVINSTLPGSPSLCLPVPACACLRLPVGRQGKQGPEGSLFFNLFPRPFSLLFSQG